MVNTLLFGNKDYISLFILIYTVVVAVMKTKREEMFCRFESHMK